MKARAMAFRDDGRRGKTYVAGDDLIKQSTAVSELFKAATAKLAPILRYNFSQLALYDASAAQLITRGSYFPNGKGLIYEGFRFPVANTPAARVFTSGKAVRINRTENLPRTDLVERLLAEGVRSGCCIPLKSGGTIIGTFNVGSACTYAFGSDTKHLLMAVAADLGAMLERIFLPSPLLVTTEAGQIPFSSATSALLIPVLIERVRAGDIAVFHELIRPFEKAIYSIAFSVLGEHAEAEEVAQESVLKALTHLHQLHSPAKFRPWLFQIVFNEARIRRRDNRHYSHEPLERLEEKFSFASPPGRDPLEYSEFKTALSRALHSLPPDYREVFILRDVQERTVIETAVALGVSTACVKTRLHRARKALRNNLVSRVSLT